MEYIVKIFIRVEASSVEEVVKMSGSWPKPKNAYVQEANWVDWDELANGDKIELV